MDFRVERHPNSVSVTDGRCTMVFSAFERWIVDRGDGRGSESVPVGELSDSELISLFRSRTPYSLTASRN
jgi:hypothetical protein